MVQGFATFRRKGWGFSPEIATYWGLLARLRGHTVARGGASRQRLQHFTIDSATWAIIHRRKGWGFSPEIATKKGMPKNALRVRSQGVGLLARDCNQVHNVLCSDGKRSRKGWGFSPEIATSIASVPGRNGGHVARGRASRQRLQHFFPSLRERLPSVARGGASRQRLQPGIPQAEQTPCTAVAKGRASRQRLQPR